MKNLPKKAKTALIAVVLVIAIGIGGIFIYNDIQALFRFEDTNGPDNYQLEHINDGDIIEMTYGSIGTPRVRDEIIGNEVLISANNFTGIYDVFYTNLLGKSDFVLDLSEFVVESGNLKAVIILDDEIVGEIAFNDEELLFKEFRLDDINGNIHFRIAGEDAKFRMRMSKSDYESYAKMQ